MVAGRSMSLYNSMGRTLAELRTAMPGHVGLYSCGMTVYADPHLGNMRPYVFSDTLRRVLEWKGWTVEQVVNITDVGHAVGDGDLGEDKVELAARDAATTVWAVTQRYTDAFFADLAALGALPHHHNPKASDYVPEMIEFARVLAGKGYTYALDSGLYFDTSRSPGYGRLALTSLDGQREGARMEVVPGKRNKADFAVWRAERPGQARLVHWDSPWGPGVPGWHLECSVMSISLLGEHFDIHTGGVDHREIHHVNEIAQSEAYLSDGLDWVPLWMHNEFLLVDNQKMAKSRGRMPILRDLGRDGYHPLAFRYFLLMAHYRKQVDFTDEAIRGASAAYKRLLQRVAPLLPLPPAVDLAELPAVLSEAGRGVLDRFDAAVSDDLNTPRLLAELNAMLRDDRLADPERGQLVAVADRLLGLQLGTVDAAQVQTGPGGEVDVEKVEVLMALRARARADRDFAAADRLRLELLKLGAQVHDGPQGSTWERVGSEAH